MNKRELEVVGLVRDLTWPTMQEGLPITYAGQEGEARYDPACCVAASRIAMEILADNFIQSSAMKTFVSVYTHDAWKWDEGGRVGPAPDPEKNIIRMCGLREARKGWLNGHVVLIVEKECLLDVSCQQFAVPNQGLPSVEPVTVDLAGEVGKTWLANPTLPLTVDIEHGVMVYQQHPDLSGLYDAPDWKARDLERIMFREHIKGLISERALA